MTNCGKPSVAAVSTTVCLALTFVFLTSGCAQSQQRSSVITAAQREVVVDSVVSGLIETYVFLEVAEEMRELLLSRLRDGAYDALTSPQEFTQQLTTDLQSISHDLHLRVFVQPPPAVGEEARPDPEERARLRLEQARRGNFGFQKVEILPGNIGYLKLNGFVDAEIAGATAVAAMNFLANADALIVDLRDNGGGSPSMIQLISSYFFAERVHLNSFYVRRTDEWEEFWTHDEVQGPRMTETPIFVLTSGRTFSAAEEFTYNLKNLERATIVGETTRGGAHPVTGSTIQFDDFAIGMTIPFGRAVNPITGTNWEGTGITAHIEVSADDALDAAVREASRSIGTRGR